MKNVHLIPTDKPSRLHLIEDVLTFTNKYKTSVCDSEVNIYITSDEEIKEGDWALDLCEDLGLKYQPFKVDKATLKYANQECKKIILTTDQDLIAEGVQPITNTFAEWFVKNPSCEFVEIYQDKKDYGSFQWYSEYKIIIPQEERKQEYQSECICENSCRGFVNVKCKQLNKQETLEDFIKVERSDLYNKIHSIVKQIPREDVETDAMDASSCAYDIEQLFYKWQQERMYSEEEVRKIAEEVRWQAIGNPLEFTKNFEKWFEQFKKK